MGRIQPVLLMVGLVAAAASQLVMPPWIGPSSISRGGLHQNCVGEGDVDELVAVDGL